MPGAKKRLVAAGQRVAAGWIIRRLMITMPPQHGKSVFASVYFLAWVLGMFPDTRIILVSYEAEYAASYGRKVRDILEEWGWLFGIRVSRRNRAAHDWSIEGHRGGMRTAGMGGSITGKSADLLVIDDPVKNQEEALSETVREKQKDFYGTTLRTRVQKNGAIILIMTRWHLDDLAGHLRALERQGGAIWEKVSLPAIALAEDEVPDGYEEVFPDPIGRQPGEALCPELHPADILSEVRVEQGEQFFWALLQGWPVAGKGGMFDPAWWSRWALSDLPVAYDQEAEGWVYSGEVRFNDLIQSWDCSGGGLKKGTSWVVGQVWGRLGPRRFLLDQIRERLDLTGTIEAVRLLSKRWPKARPILVEQKANGPEVLRVLKSELSGLTPINPQGSSKVLRAYAWTPRARAGNIFLPSSDGYPWVREWISEHSSFPKGAADDQVDASSQAQAYFEEREQVDVSLLVTTIKPPSPADTEPNALKEDQPVAKPIPPTRGRLDRGLNPHLRGRGLGRLGRR
ncbi:MAG: hypothetical protein AMXMBFR33_01560 [Candidatus Xenobia bacterium]